MGLSQGAPLEVRSEADQTGNRLESEWSLKLVDEDGDRQRHTRSRCDARWLSTMLTREASTSRDGNCRRGADSRRRRQWRVEEGGIMINS